MLSRLDQVGGDEVPSESSEPRAHASAFVLADNCEGSRSPAEGSRSGNDEGLSSLGVEDFAKALESRSEHGREYGRDVRHARVSIGEEDCRSSYDGQHPFWRGLGDVEGGCKRPPPRASRVQQVAPLSSASTGPGMSRSLCGSCLKSDMAGCASAVER